MDTSGGGGGGHAICLTVEFVLFSSFKPYNWGGTELSTMESLSTFWNVFALYVTPTNLKMLSIGNRFQRMCPPPQFQVHRNLTDSIFAGWCSQVGFEVNITGAGPRQHPVHVCGAIGFN